MIQQVILFPGLLLRIDVEPIFGAYTEVFLKFIYQILSYGKLKF